MKNSKVIIYLVDKETKQKSKGVPIEDIIFNQSGIEFEFGKWGNDNHETLSYNDFLFFQDEYEVVIRIKDNK